MASKLVKIARKIIPHLPCDMEEGGIYKCIRVDPTIYDLKFKTVDEMMSEFEELCACVEARGKQLGITAGILLSFDGCLWLMYKN